MDTQILEFLKTHWEASLADQVQYSPIPRGKPGDLALSFFALTKTLGKNPTEIATIVQEILRQCPLVEKTEVVGPYLNLFFAHKPFFEAVFETPLVTQNLKNKRILLEFSGPNTNKPLHLGHMRNHALGIALGNLLEGAGAEVHRVNIINDKGLALAKSMLAYDRFAGNQTPQDTGEKSDHFAGKWYVRYETESKKDPELEKELPAIMQKWEAGDPYWQELWKRLTDWVLAGVFQTYERQGIAFELASRESEHYEKGREFAYEGLKNGVFKKREDGTIYIDLEEDKMGQKVVLRADGTAIYLTQDLSLWPLRKAHFGDPIHEMIYVVADEQNYYFLTVFKALERLGLSGETHFVHYGYGLVNLPEGRMKSREGNVVDADNLMDELAEIAYQEIHKRHEALEENLKRETAELIMHAAWKFYLLKTSPGKTITFDPKQSIDFQGATGPYLQYAGVRIKSLFQKAEKTLDQALEFKNKAPEFLGESEKGLGVKILEWPKVLERASTNKNPTLIATYLLELCQEWSSFYNDHSILNAENQDIMASRLSLAAKVYQTLEKGLGVFGIKIPERM